ncbi:hypothetical protein GCM10025781_03240 [Kocuria gwangalliensis]|uniref:Uncharacterized protein n=1 Tax=Kocuria gwangalliensis TaxID=501592 RepID=A0ABP8WHN9_9MICC
MPTCARVQRGRQDAVLVAGDDTVNPQFLGSEKWATSEGPAVFRLRSRNCTKVTVRAHAVQVPGRSLR